MKTHLKIYNSSKYKNNKHKYTDLSQTQTYNIEVECYRRLSDYNNFPKLINADKKNFAIEIEHCGKKIDSITDTINDINKQIYNIWNALQNENILHLDIMKKNFVSKNGNLYLVDFDIAVIDNNILSSKLEKRYEDQKKMLTNIKNFKNSLKNILNG